MITYLSTILGKLISLVINKFHFGKGSTWPGHLALKMNNQFIKNKLKDSKTEVILISGTNGKTTTSKLITSILANNGHKVFGNICGANLLNGIASCLILNSSITGKIKADYLIFEIDENALAKVLDYITPDYIILLNLFRDQLDRYGEIDTIFKKWEKNLNNLSFKTKLILNADDPLIASLGMNKKNKVYYFGLTNEKYLSSNSKEPSDSMYCTKCKSKLIYKGIYFSHLGDWLCPNCKLKKPNIDIKSSLPYPLPGTYNKYNTLAALLLAKILKINEKIIVKTFNEFKPAFGRQEEIVINQKKFVIFLSKNPTSFNESLRTVKELNGNNLFIILNSRIPDGKDVSWIYDVDFENLIDNKQKIIISGDRVFDMTLRLKYAEKIANSRSFENYKEAIKYIFNKTNYKTTYVLPTYSAMLDFRKELLGKKLL